jgi:hypothetical protein
MLDLAAGTSVVLTADDRQLVATENPPQNRGELLRGGHSRFSTTILRVVRVQTLGYSRSFDTTIEITKLSPQPATFSLDTANTST